MEVPRKSATQVTSVTEIPAKRELRDCFWGEGLRPRVPTNTEGNGIGGGQDFLAIGRGAAHSNTQGKGNESIGNLLGYREGTEEKGKGETRETKDVTWGSQTSPQVYYKYGPSEGKSESSAGPP